MFVTTLNCYFGCSSPKNLPEPNHLKMLGFCVTVFSWASMSLEKYQAE